MEEKTSIFSSHQNEKRSISPELYFRYVFFWARRQVCKHGAEIYNNSGLSGTERYFSRVRFHADLVALIMELPGAGSSLLPHCPWSGLRGPPSMPLVYVVHPSWPPRLPLRAGSGDNQKVTHFASATSP